MATYIIPDLYGGAEIIDPQLEWTFAGFYRENELVVNIAMTVKLTTDTFTGSIDFLQQGSADDRSDPAIDALMIILMDQYKV